MADLPSVLFISCSDLDSDDIIKLVLNETELPEKVQIDEDIYAFPWFIDNKYYTAELRLCSLKKKTISNQKFADSVEAVVIHFDSSKKHALEDVERWLPFVNEFAPEVKILLCNNIKNYDEETTNVSKLTALEWCVSKGFELVELEPIIEDVNDEVEDDFQETTGVKRIIQALNAHVWPNLVFKNSSEKPSKKPVDESCSETAHLQGQLRLEESLEELLENDDFSQLFSQLSEMKARVSNLSGTDRKAAAEQVVKAFWKALSGDEDEFLDL